MCFVWKNFLLLSEKNEKETSEKQRGSSSIECTKATVKWPSQNIANKQDGANTLTDISFTVKPGEITAIIGQVGSGKVFFRLLFNHPSDWF